jgi:hypothetical protein
MNEWVLIATCKQLVWSSRIGRDMPIWNHPSLERLENDLSNSGETWKWLIQMWGKIFVSVLSPAMSMTSYPSKVVKEQLCLSFDHLFIANEQVSRIGMSRPHPSLERRENGQRRRFVSENMKRRVLTKWSMSGTKLRWPKDVGSFLKIWKDVFWQSGLCLVLI